MELAPGDRLGPYEILGPLGQGGMGQVYKAKDTRLDRTVAVKILPALLASDSQFRERFDREARAISQLDHPHICGLHDVGEHGGTAYLVMPFLDGETLEQRLQRAALPPGDAIQIATQIAVALSRAHSAGIIHRDLKPANIMLTKSGARLLDFGLASTIRTAPPVHTAPATKTARLTSQGTIIGTFHYMAPEQIEGAEGDARTDVWGFGCVLYEMLTGVRAFDGKTTAAVFANILNAPLSPLRERQPGSGRALDHVVQGCLEKDPDARWQSMADVARELRWAATQDEAIPPRGRSVWKHPALYGAAVVFAAAGFALSRSMSAPVAPGDRLPMKLAFVAPPGLTFTPFGSNGNPHFALSPDGTRIAYVASRAGRAPSLWVQRLDSRTPREIPGGTDASAPFWSSDSQSIAFFSEGKLRRSGLESEQSQQVLANTNATGGSWAGDVILVGSGIGPILQVPATGGRPEPATEVEPDDVGHRWPQFLEDGRHFIYTRARGGGARLGALGSMASTVLLNAGSTPVIAGRSHVLFMKQQRQSTVLQAQELDLAGRRLIGAPHAILESVRYVSGSGFPPASVSKTGMIAYWDGTTVATALTWYDRTGAPMAGLSVPRDPADFAISPNGKDVAHLRRAADGGGLWLMGLLSGVVSRVTVTTSGTARPIWSKDGSSIFLTASGTSGIALTRRMLVGRAGEEALGEVPIPDRGAAVPGNFFASDWTRNGRTALVSVTQSETGRDIMLFSADSRATSPFVATRASEVQPRFSPDERWVAYTSNETGRWEVFVDSYPRAAAKHQVSNGGGAQPIWRSDGSELFYVAPDGSLMATKVTPGERWVPANPRSLFPTRMRPVFAPYPYTYDVSPDGQRFLLSEVQPDTGPVISIATNWRDYLK